MECYDRCQEKASAKKVRESIPRQVDKKSGAPTEENQIWGSQGRDKVLEFSRRRKGQTSFFFFFLSLFLSLSHIKRFFSLSLELMITQQTTQFKFCTKDYTENSLEKERAPHSSPLAWKIPWMEEPGRLQSMGSELAITERLSA